MMGKAGMLVSSCLRDDCRCFALRASWWVRQWWHVASVTGRGDDPDRYCWPSGCMKLPVHEVNTAISKAFIMIVLHCPVLRSSVGAQQASRHHSRERDG